MTKERINDLKDIMRNFKGTYEIVFPICRVQIRQKKKELHPDILNCNALCKYVELCLEFSEREEVNNHAELAGESNILVMFHLLKLHRE